MIRLSCLLARATVLLALSGAASAWAKPPAHPAHPASVPAKAKAAPQPEPLRIGEIDSYKRQPAFSVPYRRGWELAVAQLNAGGGVLGRKIEILARDDDAAPDAAVKAAQELLDKDKVLAIFGGYSSETGLALTHFADQHKILYLAVAPLTQRITWQEGNRYTFRLRPGAWMQAAAVAPKALGSHKKHWALVYDDTESGRATVEAFKGLMKAFQSKTEFVAEQAVTSGKFDAGAAVKAMLQAKPDAIFNMLTGTDLDRWVQAGIAQHLFDQRTVVSLFTGDPENIDKLGADLPEGWIITGYPRDAVDTPANQDFVNAYRERYQEAPGTASLLGYTAMMSLAEGLKRAGAPDSEKLVQAFSGLTLETPLGKIEYRRLDHQSTLGTYLGYTAIRDGKPVMTEFVYATGARLQPLDKQVSKMREASERDSADVSRTTNTGMNSRTGMADHAVASVPTVGRDDSGLKSSAARARPAHPSARGNGMPDLKNPPQALPAWPGTIAPEPGTAPGAASDKAADVQADARTAAFTDDKTGDRRGGRIPYPPDHGAATDADDGLPGMPPARPDARQR